MLGRRRIATLVYSYDSSPRYIKQAFLFIVTVGCALTTFIGVPYLISNIINVKGDIIIGTFLGAVLSIYLFNCLINYFDIKEKNSVEMNVPRSYKSAFDALVDTLHMLGYKIKYVSFDQGKIYASQWLDEVTISVGPTYEHLTKVSLALSEFGISNGYLSGSRIYYIAEVIYEELNKVYT